MSGFPQVALHWNIRKTFHFHEDCGCVGGTNLCYLRITWNGRDCRQTKEPPLTPSKGQKRTTSSKWGDDTLVVNFGGSPAVGACFRMPAGYWQCALLPVIPTESSAPGKEFRICQQKTWKLHDKVRMHVSLWWSWKTVPAWLHSPDSSAVLTRPWTFP